MKELTHLDYLNLDIRKFLDPNFISKIEREPNIFISLTILDGLTYIYKAQVLNTGAIKSFKSLCFILKKIYQNDIKYRESERKNLLSKLSAINISENEIKEINNKYFTKIKLSKELFNYLNENIESQDIESLNPYGLYEHYTKLLIRTNLYLELDNKTLINIDEFKYSGESERKRADRLTKEGLSIIDRKLNDEIHDKEIFKDFHFKNKTAKDTSLTIAEPSNIKITNTLLSFFTKRKLSNYEFNKRESILNKINSKKEDLKNPILSKTDKATIKTEIENLNNELARLNIVNINILNANDNKESLNENFKITNANPNKVIIYNAPDNIISAYFKKYNITISQHHAEFYYTNARTKKLLNEIIKKGYRANIGTYKTNIIYFNRDELESIYNDIRDKDIIGEFRKDIERLIDFTISYDFKDNYGDKIHTDKGVLEKNSFYDGANKRAVIYINMSFLKKILNSFYHNTPKELETKNIRAELVSITEEILATPKEIEYPLTELNERTGGDTLEYIKTTKSRHIKDTAKQLESLIKEITNDFITARTNYKTTPRTEQELIKAKVKFSKKHI